MLSADSGEQRPSDTCHDVVWVWSAGVLFLAAAATFCLRQLNSFDVFWYLRTGEEILHRHALLPTDPFSYTSTQSWTNHEWLAEIWFALVHRAGGMSALVVFQAVAIAAVLAILMRRHWPSAHGERWPAWLGLSVGAGVHNLNSSHGGGDLVLYVSLDYNLRRIETASNFLRGLFSVLDFFHLPAPAISVERGKVRFGVFY